MSSTGYEVTGFSKDVSPVLLSEFDIEVSGLSQALGCAGYSIWFELSTDTSVRRPATCISATTTKVHVKFNGAPSGDYNIVMTHTLAGRFVSTTPLKVFAAIHSLSTQSVSRFGGAQVRLTGVNLSPNVLDNPVNMGKQKMTLTSSSETEITLRIPSCNRRNGKTLEFITFARTSEEIPCHGNCHVTFSDSHTPEFDYSTSDWTGAHYTYTINGRRFGARPQDTSVHFDGVAQEVLSASDNQIVVKVGNLVSATVNSVRVVPANGYADPSGTQPEAITFEPRYLSVSANEVSEFGSQVVVNAPSVSAGDSVTIADSEGTAICTGTAATYGRFLCVIAAGHSFKDGATTMSVNGGAALACAGNCDISLFNKSPQGQNVKVDAVNELEVKVKYGIENMDFQLTVGDRVSDSFTNGKCGSGSKPDEYYCVNFNNGIPVTNKNTKYPATGRYVDGDTYHNVEDFQDVKEYLKDNDINGPSSSVSVSFLGGSTY